MSDLSNLKDQNKKFRPVFTAASLEALICLVDAAPYEMRCVPENKKLIHYLKTFSFKIEHDMVTPSAILKGPVLAAKITPEIPAAQIPAAKKSRLDMTQEELDADNAASGFDIDAFTNTKLKGCIDVTE